MKEAGIWTATAICKVEGFPHLWHQLEITGLAKYAFLATSTSIINFGEILAGRSVEKEIILKNLSSVRTLIHYIELIHSKVRSTFKIKRIETEFESPFVFSTMSGMIPSNSSIPIKVKTLTLPVLLLNEISHRLHTLQQTLECAVQIIMKLSHLEDADYNSLVMDKQ
jgi:hypothetical protein